MYFVGALRNWEGFLRAGGRRGKDEKERAEVVKDTAGGK